MLEDSQLQIMRLGESNNRHLEDSDLQIFLGVPNGNVKELEVQQTAVKHSVLQKLLSLCSLGPKIVPFPRQHVPQTRESICYALSLHKAYKLAGKFIHLLECLAFSCNKATPGKSSCSWYP